MDPQLRKLVENEAYFRAANERIRKSAISFAFRPDQRVPFLCECSDTQCREIVMLSLPVYERIRAHPDRFLLCAGHEDEGGRLERVIEANDGYAVIEKIGEASAEAARLDERTR
jgi:hypothetical protein